LIIVLVSLFILNAGNAAAQTCSPASVGRFPGGPSNDNALDSRGRSNGQLLNGATFAAGQNGQAFSFDGSNDSIDSHLAQDANLNFGANDFAIEAWVNFTATGTSRTVYGNGYNNNSIVLRCEAI
jgi:hypothetical protein